MFFNDKNKTTIILRMMIIHSKNQHPNPPPQKKKTYNKPNPLIEKKKSQTFFVSTAAYGHFPDEEWVDTGAAVVNLARLAIGMMDYEAWACQRSPKRFLLGSSLLLLF